MRPSIALRIKVLFLFVDSKILNEEVNCMDWANKNVIVTFQKPFLDI